MKLIITDVTEMHSSNYCVAGWDSQAHRMVRPLPNGANWTIELLQKYGVVPGASIEMVPNGQLHPSLFPHRTEDTPISVAGIQVIHGGPRGWFTTDSPPAHANVQSAFGGRLAHSSVWSGALQGVHVVENTQVGSLSAVNLPSGALTLFEANYEGKRSLRAYLKDGQSCYNLPVVAKNLREAYRQSGVQSAQTLLPIQGDIHIRLGLARAWAAQPGKCSLMINGAYG